MPRDLNGGVAAAYAIGTRRAFQLAEGHMKKTAFVLCMLISTVLHAEGIISTERMFDACREWGRSIKQEQGANAPQAMLCAGFVAGALAGYINGSPSCKRLETATINSISADYVRYIKNAGGLNADAGVSMIVMFDKCYCGSDQKYKDAFCK